MTALEQPSTKEKLLEAALSIFSAKGYAAASVREIIALAGVSKPVLYYYAKNKADLFRSLVEDLHRRAEQDFEDLIQAPGTWQEKLFGMTRGTFQFCRENPQLARLMYQTAWGPQEEELAAYLGERGERRVQQFEALLASSGLIQPHRALAFYISAAVDGHAAGMCRREETLALLTDTYADWLTWTILKGIDSTANLRASES